MRKIILVLGWTVASVSAFSQWTDNGSSITTFDKVGINTNSVSIAGTGVNQLVIGNGASSQGLVINAGNANDGILAFANTGVLKARFIYDNSTNKLNFWSVAHGHLITLDSEGRLGLGIDPGDISGTAIRDLVIGDGTSSRGLVVNASPSHDAILAFASSNVLKARFIYDNNTSTLNFWSVANGNLMTINQTGQMGIGTTTMGTYKLAVEGSVGAREVKVEASGWSDFVFKPDYDLPTLEEVAEHIAEKGHLPEIPSETEVTENGINLGEMDAKLLQKIEELTLYLIDVNQQVQQLRSENEALKAQVNRLENEK